MPKWYITYKNNDLLHFNPNHDPRNGQFAEGRGSKPSFKRWVNSTEEDGLDRYKKNNKVTGPISGAKRGVVETIRASKKGYQKLKKVANKAANKVVEATSDEQTKYIENEDGLSNDVVNKIHNSFKNGNSAAQNAVYENLKSRPIGKDLDIDTVKKLLKKPDEIRLMKAPKGNFGTATYYGGKPGTKEYNEFTEAFSGHIIDVEFDADTGKILRVSADG